MVFRLSWLLSTASFKPLATPMLSPPPSTPSAMAFLRILTATSMVLRLSATLSHTLRQVPSPNVLSPLCGNSQSPVRSLLTTVRSWSFPLALLAPILAPSTLTSVRSLVAAASRPSSLAPALLPALLFLQRRLPLPLPLLPVLLPHLPLCRTVLLKPPLQAHPRLSLPLLLLPITEPRHLRAPPQAPLAPLMALMVRMEQLYDGISSADLSIRLRSVLTSIIVSNDVTLV